MIDLATILTGGGTAALIYATGYAYRQFRASRREDRNQPLAVTASSVTNAEAANSILLASLKEEREEVQRLSSEVAELRVQNSALYQRMREQRREYESEIQTLREQIDGFRQQLDDLQKRLRIEPS